MSTQPKTIWNAKAAEAVGTGLTAPRKSLPSWLFYDENGDRIFQQIMRMPEYYPTRCEYDILLKYKDELLKHFAAKARAFQLIELGSGDGLKTEILLKHFAASEARFTYLPVDISMSALEQLSRRLREILPQVPVTPVNKSYEDALENLRYMDGKKVILFMGANIGNFPIAAASRFLKKITMSLSSKDLLLIGFDLKKDPRIIQEAYDDPRGLTRSFNLNILLRLNRELGARFDPADFNHYPCYDPETGTMKSFLISTREQDIYFQALGTSIHFDLWEPVQTETSQKYDLDMIEKMMALKGLRIVEVYYDKARYFCDVLVTAAEGS